MLAKAYIYICICIYTSSVRIPTSFFLQSLEQHWTTEPTRQHWKRSLCRPSGVAVVVVSQKAMSDVLILFRWTAQWKTYTTDTHKHSRIDTSKVWPSTVEDGTLETQETSFCGQRSGVLRRRHLRSLTVGELAMEKAWSWTMPTDFSLDRLCGIAEHFGVAGKVAFAARLWWNIGSIFLASIKPEF